jgi:hypothetical protein
MKKVPDTFSAPHLFCIGVVFGEDNPLAMSGGQSGWSSGLGLRRRCGREEGHQRMKKVPDTFSAVVRPAIC